MTNIRSSTESIMNMNGNNKTPSFFSTDSRFIKAVLSNNNIITYSSPNQVGGEHGAPFTTPHASLTTSPTSTSRNAETLPVTVAPANLVQNFYDDLYSKSPERKRINIADTLPFDVVSSKEPQKHNYTLIKKYGRGAYGQVYLARDNNSENTSLNYVMKIIPLLPNTTKSAQNEVRILQKLARYGCKSDILCYHDSFEDTFPDPIHGGYVPSLFILTKEFPNSITLTAFKDNHKNANKFIHTYSLLKIFRNLLSALLFIHKIQIAHADIKPDNILINKDLGIQLIDFGIACDKPTIKTSKPCTVTGTPLFQSPELLFKLHEETTLSELQKGDVFSMGMVFFELANLILPFGETSHNCIKYFYKEVGGFLTDDDRDYYTKHCKVMPTNFITSSYSYIPPDLPKHNMSKTYAKMNKKINQLIQKMLDTNPDTRPTIEECSKALNKIIDAFNSVPFKSLPFKRKYVSEVSP